MKMAKEDNEKLWDQKYDKYIKKRFIQRKRNTTNRGKNEF